MFDSAPDDFVEFWTGAKQEAESIAIDYWREPQSAHSLDSHQIEVLTFRSVEGAVLEGWFAIPKETKHAPGFLWINPYGRESLLPNEYGTRPGYVSFCFNFFGLSAFHQEKYTPSRGYFAEGLESPETSIFRKLVQHCMVALRVLRCQIEVNEDQIGIMGMSQGGGLAIATSAWSSIPMAMCADMPFLGGISQTLGSAVYRYPLKEIIDFAETHPLGMPTAQHTLSYFDTVFHAQQVKIPTHVTLGLKDPACKPPSVRNIYNSLHGTKELLELDWGHDWHPVMVNTNQKWLDNYLLTQ